MKNATLILSALLVLVAGCAYRGAVQPLPPGGGDHGGNPPPRNPPPGNPPPNPYPHGASDQPSAYQGMPSRYEVTISDYSFQPDSIEIHVGDTVMWVNRGNVEHTTTSSQHGGYDGTWDARVAPGSSYSHAFNTPGTYYYVCRLHAARDMKGTIVVDAR